MSFTSSETVGKIAVDAPGTTREFERLGIDYCCGGGRTLAEACAQLGMNVEEVLTRLEQSVASDSSKTGRNWTDAPLTDLIAHINSTHHVFVRSECPRIEALAAKVAGVHGKNHPELLTVQRTFAALAGELHVHLMKEEQILFPYVLRMEESALAGEPAPPAMFGTVANPIRMMVHDHDGAGEALRVLQSVTGGYKAPEDACISYRTLYGALQEFENDLHQHIHLENNVLFPRAAAMEQASRR